MENKKLDNTISIIAIILIIGILMYVFYAFLTSNNAFNSNELINNISENVSNKVNISSNNIAAVEKEIVYTETEVASFTTTLYDSDPNRIFNITKACAILNNTEIKKGQQFSFNETLGPMGIESGYKLAKGFDSNGKLIDVPAGGMCQVSSTLYNVALLLNLEITERHPHSRRVAYVPQDKDATIYYPSLDLKFINNTDNDLKITAQNDNYTVTIKMYKKEQSN